MKPAAPAGLPDDVMCAAGTEPCPCAVASLERAAELDAKLTAATEQIAALHERLEANFYFDGDGNRHECKPGEFPDGIECRDETIKLQDKQIAALRAKVQGYYNEASKGWTEFRSCERKIAALRAENERLKAVCEYASEFLQQATGVK